MVVCLIKLLVYGEPIVNRSNRKTDDMKKIAHSIEMQFRSGDLTVAKMAYLRHLQCYGIHLPAATNITWLECITYTSWQLARTIIHRLPFGLWLSRKIGGLYCSNDVRSRAMQTYKEIGWTLHRLNQIDLMETQKQADAAPVKWQHRVHGFMVTLYAINMIESAEPIVNTKEIVEVYLNAMLRMKLFCSNRLLSSYFLRKAKFYHLLSTTQQASFDWIFTEHGYKFVSNLKLSVHRSSVDDDDDDLEMYNGNTEPVTRIQQKYRRFLLTMALEKLLGLHSRNADTSHMDDGHYKTKHSQTADVLVLTKHLLETMSTDDPAKENELDTLLWVARIILVTAYWSTTDMEKDSANMYGDIDDFMRAASSRRSKQATLIKSLYMIFVGKREFVHHIRPGQVPSDRLQSILKHCNIASCLLQNQLAYNRSQANTSNRLIYLVQMLVCDWLLELRTDCWDMIQSDGQTTFCDEPSAFRISNLEFYQIDLSNLYLIFDTKALIQSRVCLYEAIYRLMAGATPLDTYSLLWRNIEPSRQTRSNLICAVANKSNADEYYTHGERERARSMLLACKYLQSQVKVERAGLLAQAASIFKNIGEMAKANECYYLMKEGSLAAGQSPLVAA